MGNVTSIPYSKLYSTEENEKNLDINIIKRVIDGYVSFLRQIAFVISENHTHDLEREQQEFNAFRNELLDYLFKHRSFFKLKAIQLLSANKSVLHTLSLYNSLGIEKFLKLDDFYKLQLKLNNIKEVSIIKYKFVHVEEKIIKRIKFVLKQTVVSDEDIQIFLENHYLIDKYDLKSKCSNYKELNAYIHNRRVSYQSLRINPIRVHVEFA